MSERQGSDLISLYQESIHDNHGSTLPVSLDLETLQGMAQDLPDNKNGNLVRTVLEFLCTDDQGNLNGLTFSLYLKDEKDGGILGVENDARAMDLYYSISQDSQIELEEDFLVFLDDDIADEPEGQIARTDAMIEFEENQSSITHEQRQALFGFFLAATQYSLSAR